MSLPDDIKAQFEPFETIGPSDNRYMAQPRFVEYPPNYLKRKGWLFTSERVAADGSKWIVRTYSPFRGFFDVIFCPVIEGLPAPPMHEDLEINAEDGSVTDKISDRTLTACECDESHKQQVTVCRFCQAYGRRLPTDPVPPPARTTTGVEEGAVTLKGEPNHAST